MSIITTTAGAPHCKRDVWKRAQAVVLAALLVQTGLVHGADVQGTTWGFTPFPHDITLEAVNQTYDVIEKNATLFSIHRDNGVPWQEALEDKPFPKKVTEEWQSSASHIRSNQKVYVGLAPLAMDRKSLAPASEGSKTPKSFLGNPLNSPEVKQAYLNYVRRAIKTFKPDYLNIGIEVGELASRSETRWHQFEELFDFVKAAVKSEHPEVYVGISFGLQSLMEPKIAKLSKPLVDKSDYIGISFYPYMSEFHQALGSAALPPPPRQWMDPLNWLRAYTDKPIGICETGYTTIPLTLSQPKLSMSGDPDLQARYLRDLAAVSKRDGYLFVTWFLPIDYEALSHRLNFKKGDAMRLWENIGLFSANLQPKPAWSVWQEVLAGNVPAGGAAGQSGALPKQAPEPATRTPASADGTAQPRYIFDLANAGSVFKGSKFDDLQAAAESPDNQGKSMRWSFEYGKRFQWAYAAIERGALDGASGMRLWTKGSQDTFVLVSFEEGSGEAYWAVVPVSAGWKQVDLKLADFKRDDKKAKKNGRFDPADVVSVTLADPRGLEGATGRQAIWVANWAAY